MSLAIRFPAVLDDSEGLQLLPDLRPVVVDHAVGGKAVCFRHVGVRFDDARQPRAWLHREAIVHPDCKCGERGDRGDWFRPETEPPGFNEWDVGQEDFDILDKLDSITLRLLQNSTEATYGPV